MSQLWIRQRKERMNKVTVKEEEEGGLLRPVAGSRDDLMSPRRKMIYIFDVSVERKLKEGVQLTIC